MGALHTVAKVPNYFFFTYVAFSNFHNANIFLFYTMIWMYQFRVRLPIIYI